MKRIIFDSYALIALFRLEKGYEEVTQLLTEILKGERMGFMSVINLGEVYYTTYRKQGAKKAELALSSVLQFPIEIIEADFDLTFEAAKLKAKYKISYADAFAAALTKSKRGWLVTGDKEFKALKDEIKIKFI